MNKILISTLAALVAGSSLLASAPASVAQDYEWRRPYHGRYPPPPPPRRHHHDNTGAAIAGGLAAGVIGGMIGGALVNNGPRYVEPPPPPPPRCWFEDRQVANAYDGGWHMESVRVCR